MHGEAVIYFSVATFFIHCARIKWHLCTAGNSWFCHACMNESWWSRAHTHTHTWHTFPCFDLHHSMWIRWSRSRRIISFRNKHAHTHSVLAKVYDKQAIYCSPKSGVCIIAGTPPFSYVVGRTANSWHSFVRMDISHTANCVRASKESFFPLYSHALFSRNTHEEHEAALPDVVQK